MRGLFKEKKQDPNKNIFTIKSDIEEPKCEPGQVKVKVTGCGLSQPNKQILDDIHSRSTQPLLPVGHEVSGVIVGVGSETNFVSIGDHVAGLLPLDSACSGCSELCVFYQHDLVRLPPELPLADAAAVVGDGIKAYTALHYQAGITSGDTVLIMNGASPFGNLCIQLAQLWGAKIITTAGSEEALAHLDKMKPQPAHVIELDQKNDLLTSSVMEETGGLGVDVIIDSGVRMFTTDEDLSKMKEDCSHHIPHKHELLSCLGVGGRWVTSRYDLQLDPPDSKSLHLRGASLSFLFEHVWTLSTAQHGRYQHILHDLMEKLASRTLKPPPIRKVNLDNAVDALSTLSHHSPAKVVVTL